MEGVVGDSRKDFFMARTYHKIDTCDKADSVVLLLDAGVTREQIMRWFQISDRTLRWYLKQGGGQIRSVALGSD